MEVDKTRDEVYVSDGGNMYWRFDGSSGEGTLLKKTERRSTPRMLRAGYDGLLYFQTGTGFSGPLERYTRELEPAPYPSGTHVLSKYIYGRYGIGNCEKGIGVGPDGKVFSAWMLRLGQVRRIGLGIGWQANQRQAQRDRSVQHEGRRAGGIDQSVHRPIPQCNGGVRVDLKGNIYVGMIAGKTAVPKKFEKNDAYKHCTGSVVKFGPEGGTVPASRIRWSVTRSKARSQLFGPGALQPSALGDHLLRLPCAALRRG